MARAILNGYKLEKYLGAGKYGTVYQASDPAGNLRAIKILWHGSPERLEQAIEQNTPPSTSADHIKRFSQEIEILTDLSKYSRRSLQGSYVPRVYDSKTDAQGSGWCYIVTDFVAQPSIIRLLNKRQAEKREPLIPEPVALELTLRFLQLLNHLHERGLHLLDAQLKNYCLDIAPDDPNQTKLDFIILDWNGTKTFEETREERALSYPASYDLRAAIAFTYEMLTGSTAFATRTLTPSTLASQAKGHWAKISPGTRRLMENVLSLEAGMFSTPGAPDVIGQLEKRLELWRGGWRAISTEAGSRGASIDLEDLEWFAQRFDDQEKLETVAQLRSSGALGKADYFAEALAELQKRDPNYQQASSKYRSALDISISRLSQDDLRARLALASVDRHIKEGNRQVIANRIVAELNNYPSGSVDAQVWQAYDQEVKVALNDPALPADLIEFFGPLQHEAELRAEWYTPRFGNNATLEDIRQQLPSLDNYSAIKMALASFHQKYLAWQDAEPESPYRLRTVYDLLGEKWDDTVDHPVEATHMLDRIEASIAQQEKRLADRKTLQREMMALAKQGDLRKLRDRLESEWLRQGHADWLVDLINVAVDEVLSSGKNIPEAIKFARDQQDRLSDDTKRRLSSLEAVLSRLNRVDRQNPPEPNRADFDAITDSVAMKYFLNEMSVIYNLGGAAAASTNAFLNAIDMRQKGQQEQYKQARRDRIPEELREAYAYEAVSNLINQALVVNLIDDQTPILGSLTALHDHWQQYLAMKLNYPDSGLPPRSKWTERNRFREHLRTLEGDLAAARGALGRFTAGWVDQIQIEVVKDIHELDPNRRLRYIAPFIVVAALIVMLAIAVAVFASRSQIGAAEQTAAANSTNAARVQAVATEQRGTEVANQATTNAVRLGNDLGTATAFNKTAVAVENANGATQTAFVAEQTRSIEQATGTQVVLNTQAALVVLATATEQAHLTATASAVNRTSTAVALAQQAMLDGLNTQIAQRSIDLAGTNTAVARTPLPPELTATAQARFAPLTQIADTATESAHATATQQIYLTATQRVIDLIQSDCTIETIFNGSASVYRDEDFQRYALSEQSLNSRAIGILGSQTPKVIGQRIVFGENWLEIANYLQGGQFAFSVAWVRQSEVTFLNPDCDRFLVVTLTATPTPSSTPTSLSVLTFSVTQQAIEEITAALTAQVTEPATKELTLEVTESVTEELTLEATESVTEELTLEATAVITEQAQARITVQISPSSNLRSCPSTLGGVSMVTYSTGASNLTAQVIGTFFDVPSQWWWYLVEYTDESTPPKIDRAWVRQDRVVSDLKPDAFLSARSNCSPLPTVVATIPSVITGTSPSG